MGYAILITKSAKKDIDAFDTTVKKQLAKKLRYFESLDEIKSVAKKLENFALGEYRLRVGNYRIHFDLDKNSIVILRIQHRKDVYR